MVPLDSTCERNKNKIEQKVRNRHTQIQRSLGMYHSIHHTHHHTDSEIIRHVLQYPPHTDSEITRHTLQYPPHTPPHRFRDH